MDLTPLFGNTLAFGHLGMLLFVVQLTTSEQPDGRCMFFVQCRHQVSQAELRYQHLQGGPNQFPA